MNVTSRTNAVFIAIGGIGAVLVIAQPVWPPAAVVTVLALLTVPGQAIATWIPSTDAATRAVLAVALGVSVLAVVALLMVWTRFWHPRPAAAIVLAVAVVSLAIRIAAPGPDRRDRQVAA